MAAADTVALPLLENQEESEVLATQQFGEERYLSIDNHERGNLVLRALQSEATCSKRIVKTPELCLWEDDSIKEEKDICICRKSYFTGGTSQCD